MSPSDTSTSTMDAIRSLVSNPHHHWISHFCSVGYVQRICTWFTSFLNIWQTYFCLIHTLCFHRNWNAKCVTALLPELSNMPLRYTIIQPFSATPSENQNTQYWVLPFNETVKCYVPLQMKELIELSGSSSVRQKSFTLLVLVDIQLEVSDGDFCHFPPFISSPNLWANIW